VADDACVERRRDEVLGARLHRRVGVLDRQDGARTDRRPLRQLGRGDPEGLEGAPGGEGELDGADPASHSTRVTAGKRLASAARRMPKAPAAAIWSRTACGRSAGAVEAGSAMGVLNGRSSEGRRGF
jgi:hypothetical protein